MNTNIQGDFQICISAPLRKYLTFLYLIAYLFTYFLNLFTSLTELKNSLRVFGLSGPGPRPSYPALGSRSPALQKF